MKTCDRNINEAEFAAIVATADRVSEKDYRSCQSGPLIKFAHCGDAVVAMAYYDQGPAGEPGNHFYAA